MTGNVKSLSQQEDGQFILNAFLQLGQDLHLHYKDVQTLRDRFRFEGLSFLMKTLPILSKALNRALADGRLVLPTNFRRVGKCALPVFLGSHFRKIFDFAGKLLPSPDIDAIRQITQLCTFGYKIKRDFTEEQQLDVYERFISNEADLRCLHLEDDTALRTAAQITQRVFGDFDERSLECKNGPGVTSDTPFHLKFDSQLPPHISDNGFGSHFFFNAEDGITRLDRYPIWRNDDYFHQPRNVAKVILVPKDSRGPRLISCEPCSNMFVQQGIMAYMVSKLQSHPFSSGHIGFEDQTVNQTMSRKASIDQSFSTLDLKDASDLVSVQLVKRVFAGTSLLDALMRCRSHSTLIGIPKEKHEYFTSRYPQVCASRSEGLLVSLYKHAPMGSAVCFPVMAYTIYVLLFVALIGAGLNPVEARESLYVYGDDIVIATKYARLAHSVLTRYGLKINSDKSFINSRFAESCGTDWFDGQLVSPIKMRDADSVSIGDLNNPHTLVSTIALANLLSDRGYTQASEYLFRFCEKRIGLLPYGLPTSPFLCRHVKEDYPYWEANFLRMPTSWVPDDDPNNQYGARFVGLRIKVKKSRSFRTSAYSHMTRTFPLIGKELVIPDMGVYDMPKKVVLKPRKFNPCVY